MRIEGCLLRNNGLVFAKGPPLGVYSDIATKPYRKAATGKLTPMTTMLPSYTASWDVTQSWRPRIKTASLEHHQRSELHGMETAPSHGSHIDYDGPGK